MKLEKKKEATKGRKKVILNVQVFSSLFPPFRSFFGSLFPFHGLWVLLLFLEGHIALQMFKASRVNFSRFYHPIICQL
jgi:hypothetical protein